jgi:hypothetical protein
MSDRAGVFAPLGVDRAAASVVDWKGSVTQPTLFQLARDPVCMHDHPLGPGCLRCPRCAWLGDADTTDAELQGLWADLEARYLRETA